MTRVSVVIPCYNDGTFLPEAVASAEAQTHDDVEIVVIDDGSNDEKTLDVLRMLERSGTPVLRRANGGASAARNAAIAAATGDYILPLDSDDLLGRTFAAGAAALLDQDAGIDVVGGSTEFFGAEKGRVDPIVPHPVEWLLANHLPVSAVYRRSSWERAGGYQVQARWGEDWLLWVAMVAQGAGFAVLPEIGLHYRRRPGQTTANVPWEVQEETLASVLMTGREIAVAYPREFSDLLAQRLTLLQVLRRRYRGPERAIAHLSRLARRRGRR